MVGGGKEANNRHSLNYGQEMRRRSEKKTFSSNVKFDAIWHRMKYGSVMRMNYARTSDDSKQEGRKFRAFA